MNVLLSVGPAENSRRAERKKADWEGHKMKEWGKLVSAQLIFVFGTTINAGLRGEHVDFEFLLPRY